MRSRSRSPRSRKNDRSRYDQQQTSSSKSRSDRNRDYTTNEDNDSRYRRDRRERARSRSNEPERIDRSVRNRDRRDDDSRERYDASRERRSRDDRREARDRRRRRHDSRNRRSRSRSRSPSKKGGAVPKYLMNRPEISDKDLEGKTEEEQEMLKLMGFAGFDTTKNKKVQGNDVSAVNVLQKRKYRQYMNRKEDSIVHWILLYKNSIFFLIASLFIIILYLS
ncbi:U4/U6.U5 small nuclear ribonucleoprotein 27 kDa protein [Sarcoptes scabiei]|uniref:U4/U6.U5 small nuclear ribonucleoprotein 27 kDa protein n=1 Tax=Sarcoptes scabiei TaxID=52283 RepID=A0A834RD41_SARSC|nr:U4/U6.U5 small nuclear ribonucleoprotein 27 kDa protein [Sarcoptes scabiei]